MKKIYVCQNALGCVTTVVFIFMRYQNVGVTQTIYYILEKETVGNKIINEFHHFKMHIKNMHLSYEYFIEYIIHRISFRL